MRVPTWVELGGAEGWVREIHRQIAVMQCRSTHHVRFERTCRLLEPWRIRSSVHTNRHALAGILEILENARRNRGSIMGPGSYAHRTGWTRAELGELLVEIRNRITLDGLRRDRARIRGPKFDPRLMPDRALEALIQRHRDLAVVEKLRAERQRRAQA